MRWSPALILIVLTSWLAAQPNQVRGVDTPWTFPEVHNRADWATQAARMRTQILFHAGLWPLPPKTPLNPQIFGRLQRNGYSVEKVYFESVPGFYVTGNLYRPVGKQGPFPGVICPHGHSAYGRLENNEVDSEPVRAINLALQGYVVFTYDMVGYNDSRQVPHDYASRNAELWSFSVLGLQLWNSIRALDFLETLPDVDGMRLAATAHSGGGTQVFLAAAVDSRIKVAAPVNMISAYMQGGDNCENAAGLRVEHSNMEFAALIAPRPLLMVSADGDWTRDTPRVEFPAIQNIYKLMGAEDRVQSAQFHAVHNYNRDSREAMYGFFAHWVLNSAELPKERGAAVEKPADLLVFYGRVHPGGATPESLLQYWSKLPVDPKALVYAAGVRWPDQPPTPDGRLYQPEKGKIRGAVVVSGREDLPLIEELKKSGIVVLCVVPYRETRNTGSRYFTTYNLTADQLRVQRILNAASWAAHAYGQSELGISLLGMDGGGVAALVARAVAPHFRKTVVNLERFDSSKDQDYLDNLFIPGIRRAGGLPKLDTPDVKVHNGEMGAKEIAVFLLQR